MKEVKSWNVEEKNNAIWIQWIGLPSKPDHVKFNRSLAEKITKIDHGFTLIADFRKVPTHNE
jgi:hypothetical protein